MSGVVEVSGGLEDVGGGSDDGINDDEIDGAVEEGGGNGVFDRGVRDGKEKVVDVEVKVGIKTVAVDG